MWPSIRDGFVNFFTNKAYFEAKWDRWVTKVRAAVLMLGAAIAIPGDFQTATMKLIPPAWVQIVGLGIMGLGVVLRAGEMNTKES